MPSMKPSGVTLRSGDDEPARPVAGDTVGLRQPVEGEHQQVGRDRGHRNVHGVVEQDAVVDLVREHEQRILARDVGDAFEDLARVDRSGRVVRVDHDDRLGARRHLGADVFEVGLPPVLLVGEVVDGCAAAEAGHGRPQRVIGRRDQHLVALVEQRLHDHRDEFGHAVAQVDVVGSERREGRILLVAVHDRAARRDDAATVAVPVGVRHGLDHVAHDLERRVEPEHRGVAGVELEDRVAVVLEPVGFDQRLAPDLVEDVLELARLIEGAKGAHRFRIVRTRCGQSTGAGLGRAASGQRRRRVARRAETTWKISVAAIAMRKTADAITFACGGMPRWAAT